VADSSFGKQVHPLRSAERSHNHAARSVAARRKDALYRLADHLQQARSRADIYEAALEAIVTALPCDRASILLFDDAGAMRFVAWRDLSDDYRRAVEGHSPWSTDETNPKPICVSDVATAELSAPLKAVIAAEGIGAAAFIPLVTNGRLLGKFMSYFDAPHSFEDDEIELSLAIARQLALAIERERSDEALRASEQRFRDMIDALPAAIYTTDADGRITHYNPAAVEFSGRVPKLGTDDWCVTWKLYNPDGTPLPHAKCPMAVALKEDRAIRGAEAIAERPDGSRRWFTPYPTPLHDDFGRVIGGINMLVDITKSKEAERALRESGKSLTEELEAVRRLQALSIELIRPDKAAALYEQIADAAAALMRSDLASVQMLYPEQGDACELHLLAVRGFDPPTTLFWQWVGSEPESTCGRALRTGQRVVVTDVDTCDWLDGTDGRRVYSQAGIRAAQSTPLLSRSGEIVGMITTHWRQPHEPSERDLRLLDILARQAADLIERKQAEAALRHSEERLRAADRRKDEFLAMLAHELRNPLAPIRNVSEVLARLLPADPKLQEAVAVIKRQTAQLTRLVDDLLDVSRITSGRIELKRADLEIGAIIGQAVETVKPLLDEKNHRVSITSSYRPLHVNGDCARLEQCVVNVLANAAKYTDACGEIRIQTFAEEGSAVIEIRDNGAGISAELLPRIFDLFVQSDRTLDRAEGGLGIGLSIVKRLIEMHGGRIAAHSEGAGRGSRFEIRLPLIAAPRSVRQPVAQSAVLSKRVLIVDDNADAANSLALLLELDGHEVQAVYTANDALQCLPAFKPEVALLDIGLPEMDGYCLAGHIRQLSDCVGLRLIALTGYGQADDVNRARAAGFDEHLVKPLDFALLRRTLERFGKHTAPQ
jgi:signal transduction histidine kinase/ActR/RegA family two-component response regulator